MDPRFWLIQVFDDLIFGVMRIVNLSHASYVSPPIDRGRRVSVEAGR